MKTFRAIFATLALALALNGTMWFVTATQASPVPTGAVIWEDGSWTAPNGDTGCIESQPCQD